MTHPSNTITLHNANDILNYWFGPEYAIDRHRARNVDYIKSRFPLYFGSTSPEFNQIQHDNIHLIDILYDDHRAASFFEMPHNDHQNSENDAEVGSFLDRLTVLDLLAMVIILDQFPRCCYRGTSQAFAYDDKAVQYAKVIVDRGWYYSDLTAIERLFVHLPFAHSEDTMLSSVGVDIGNRIGEGESDEVISYFKSLSGFPDEHYHVVKRFGRFPSRNHALGRSFTAEEIDWMNSDACPKWAKSQVIVPNQEK